MKKKVTGTKRKMGKMGDPPSRKVTPGNSGVRGTASNVVRGASPSQQALSANQLRAMNRTPTKPSVPTESQYNDSIAQQREAWYNNTSPTARRRGGSEVSAGNRTRLQPPRYPSYDEAYPRSTPLQKKKR